MPLLYNGIITECDILPSTGQENNASQPNTAKWFSFSLHFSSGDAGRCCKFSELRSCVKVEVASCPGLPVPNGPYGLCGRKATLNNTCQSSGAV